MLREVTVLCNLRLPTPMQQWDRCGAYALPSYILFQLNLGTDNACTVPLGLSQAPNQCYIHGDSINTQNALLSPYTVDLIPRLCRASDAEI